MIPTPNPGDRPSKLDLDRYATGELSELERKRVEASLDDAGRAHLAALERAKASVPPFDAARLRQRAASLPPDPVVRQSHPSGRPSAVLEIPRIPTPSNRSWYAVLALVAAAALLAVLVALQPPDAPDVRFRTGDSLQVFQLQGRKLYAYDGAPVGQDDVLGFKVAAAGHTGLVLLSVDGEGAVEVFYPETGDAPEPLAGDGLVALPGTIVLDAAPGPEVFVVVFDRTVTEAKEELQHTWQSGGPEAVLEWAEKAPGVDAVEVHRE